MQCSGNFLSHMQSGIIKRLLSAFKATKAVRQQGRERPKDVFGTNGQTDEAKRKPEKGDFGSALPPSRIFEAPESQRPIYNAHSKFRSEKNVRKGKEKARSRNSRRKILELQR